MTRGNFQLLFGLFFSLLLMNNCSSTQNVIEMTGKSQAHTVELTSFQLNEGTDESAFVKVAEQMQAAFLNHQEGFVKRTLVKGADGWTDVVYWQSPEAMKQAMQQAETAEEVAPFMQMINFSTVKMNLSEIRLNAQ